MVGMGMSGMIADLEPGYPKAQNTANLNYSLPTRGRHLPCMAKQR